MLPCTFFRLLFLAFLLLGLASLALPQTAEITGLVNDSSGAVIPGAKVAVMHEQTRLTRQTVTNAEGYFTVLFLPPGSYEIRVSAEGFKPVVRSQLILNVGQVARLDFTLEVGPLSEQVTVSSEAPLLNTETPSVAQVVENKLVETLPLNGRNYTQLVALTTGAVPNPISRAADAVQLNGHRVSQTTYFIDGVDNNNYIISADTGTTQTIRPSVDAIQEFRVESSNFNARYGRSAGGVVNVSIKSGTNELHGTVFEFLRNDVFDATDFFTNRTGGKKNPYRFNQFGATLGGPFIKNRWFWFGSYQGTVIRTARTSVTTVPTPTMKQGVFPLPIHDPLTVNLATLTRQPFPANTIPRDRWDGVAAKLIQLYQDPNLQGLANNYAGPITTETNHHQVDVRTDYLATAKDTLFFRLSRQDSKTNQGSLFGPPGYGGNFFLDQPVIRPMPAWSVVGGHNRIFSPAWANEFRLGYTNNFSDHQTPSPASLFADYGIRGVPRSEEIKGLPTFYPYGSSVLGDRLFEPNKRTAAVTQAANNVTWLRSRHTVQFGGEFRWIRQYYNAAAPGAQASRGIFVFAGLYTSPSVGALGLSLPDFLLGQTTRLTISRDTDADLASYYSAFYVSDTWKLTTRLTLDVGLRYELLSPIWEIENRIANFDLNPNSPTYGTLVKAKPGSIRDRSFVYLDKNNFGPRLGLAYRLTENTIVRAAGGIFYGGREYIELPPGNLPFSVAVSTRINPIISALPLQGGLPPGILDPQNAIDPGASFLFERRPALETYQWNLSVQRGIPGHLALTVSYVGSGTSHIAASRNVSEPPPGTTERRFPQFSSVVEASPYAHATYHSLQAKIERRFISGFALLSSYTWSHAIDGIASSEDLVLAIGPQDPYNLRLEKASSAIDVRHRSVTSAIWDVPVGRPGRLFGNNSVLRALLGNWQVAGIFVAQTGLPVNPGVSRPVSAGLSLRPDVLRSPHLPKSRRTVDRWFDPGAFAVPPVGKIGTAGRNILRAPGLVNLDLLLARSFRLAEAIRLDFRGELFNALNHTHLGAPNATTDQPQAGAITSVLAPPRQIQFGFKLVF